MAANVSPPGGRVLSRLQDGVAVAVLETLPQEMLGVRDAFMRYFGHRVGRRVPIALVPHRLEEERLGLAASDEEAVSRARRRMRALRERLGDAYHFHVAVEGALDRVAVDDEERIFVRSWCVLAGLGGESWGASGSLEIPRRVLGENLDARSLAPGKRRGGGLISSLTGGAGNRRSAVAESTFHALCSLVYAVYDSHPLKVPGT
jgi:non-canonical (house-cleaning) NTP pyrophosphatase